MTSNHEPDSDPNGLDVEPETLPEEREELGHLRYFESKLNELESRGLITPEASASVRAESQTKANGILHLGRMRAAISQVKAMAAHNPAAALALAEKVSRLDSDRADASRLIVDILWATGRDEEAVAQCAEASERFPEFVSWVAELRRELPIRVDRRRVEAEQASQKAIVSDWLVQAKQALETSRDSQVIELCDQILSIQPDHIDGLAYLAFALQRSGRTDESLERYRRLQQLQPYTTAWSGWVRELSRRSTSQAHVQRAAVVNTPAEPEADPTPRVSWASISGEFLQEHWQKLILCMAVLLIVASSTIGAHVLLGPKLWSPIGKCTLALMITSLFAALGISLTRWGAARAGEIMLVTTLIVAPIHFMLAGELGLLSDVAAANLGLAMVDLLAVVGLIRAVAGQIVLPRQAWFLTSSLALVSASNAVAVQDLPSRLWPIGAFEAPAIFFLLSIGYLGRQARAHPSKESSNFLPLTLGLLSFAMLASVLRIGGYELRLEPAYFGAPVMIAAGACLLLAGQLREITEKPENSYLGWLKLVGFTLSALAFALVLARSTGSPRLFDGNTLAVALMGLAIYGISLRIERHPAYLYLSIAAFALCVIATLDVVLGAERPLEVFVGRQLGYPGKPPLPFRSIQMIGLNAILAGLSVWFARKWNDERLAWHCDMIGLPLSVAACVLSAFEPKAAVICLSIYAPLYLIASRLLSQPFLTYLGIAALAGAIHFLDRVFNPSADFGSNAIAATALGFVCWGVANGIARDEREGQSTFRRPWLFGSLTLSLGALALAVLDMGSHDSVRVQSVGMFAAVAALLVLLTREFPTTILAYLALGSGLIAWMAIVAFVQGTGDGRASTAGISSIGFDLTLLGIALFLRARGYLSVMARAIPRFVIGTVLLVEAAHLTTLGEHWTECLVFALGAVALFWTNRSIRSRWLVDVGLACVAGAVANLVWWIAPRGNNGLVVGWEGVAVALVSLAFWGAAIVGRRRILTPLYATPCLQWSLVMTGVAFGLAIQARLLSQEAYVLSLAGLLLDCVVILLIGRVRESSLLTYYGIATFVAAAYVLLLSVGTPDPKNAHVLGLVAVILGLLFWIKGFACRRLGRRWAELYEEPLFVSSLLLTVVSVPLGYWSPMTMVLASISFLLMIKCFPSSLWIYPAVATFGFSAAYGPFSARPMSAWLIFLVGSAYGLWVFALIVRKAKAPLCRLLGLPELSYEYALANSSIVLALLAVAVRIAWSIQAGVTITDHPEWPLALACLAFLMRMPYRSAAMIHAGFGLLTWSSLSTANPSMHSVAILAAAASIVACVFVPRLLLAMFVVLAWVLRNADHTALNSAINLAVGTTFLALVFIGLVCLVQTRWFRESLSHTDWLELECRLARRWSIGLWGVSCVLAATVIVVQVVCAVFPELWESVLKIEPRHWKRLFLAMLTIAGTFKLLIAERADSTLVVGEVRITRARFELLLALGMVWWIAAVPSFTGNGLIPSPDYLPLATALYSLSALGALRYANRSVATADPFIEQMIFLTAILGAIFTRGAVGVSTVLTLMASSVSLGLLGLTSRSHDIGRVTSYGAGIAWMVALGMAGLEVARHYGWTSDEQRAISAAVGLIVAAYSLLPLTALVRRFQSMLDSDPSSSVGREWTIASEWIAFLGSLIATACIVFASLSPGATGPTGMLVGVGVLVTVALIDILLAGRWVSEALVYLAQGMLLGAYIVYRQAFPAPIATDAMLLTLLAYLDFGIAEVMDRQRLSLYARPIRFVSFLLPLIPLVPMLGEGRLDDVGMFHLLAAGTFYGLAFSSTQWRILGYAAAVLYNAALWVWWSRLGWTMADNPQFYFIPVGLSGILFAEANRQELGTRTVNGIRSVGLILIYLTSAFPILNDQSFGAWLTLLILSLVGIFAGIGLRARIFLWLGLATFLFDIAYQLVRFSADYAFAKWAIMLGLGIGLVLFVALNEKKKIVVTMKEYYDQIKGWE